MALRESGCRGTIGNARMINETLFKLNFQGVCVAPCVYETTTQRVKMNVHQMFATLIEMIGLHLHEGTAMKHTRKEMTSQRESIVRMAIIEATVAHHLLGVPRIGGQLVNPDDSGIPEVRHRLRDQRIPGTNMPFIN